MTLLEIQKKSEEEFLTKWENGDFSGVDIEGNVIEDYFKVKSFLRTSTIKLIEGEILRLNVEKKEPPIGIDFEELKDVDAYNSVYNKALHDQISYYESQLKELRK